MKRRNQDSVVITARVQAVHKAQLEEVAAAERRTKSSMLRCLIERAYQEFIRRKKSGEVKNGQGRIYTLGESE